MGSFAISALGSHGAAIVDTIRVWPSFLNYGPIAPDGGVDIYLSVDHRVIDGGPAARAIRALEAMLNGPVLDELRALANDR
jgi:pyruvate/2-oxoglutarate dehydrogenase complex dihydrolipoamide acyltransferase (E2) component